MQLDTRRAIADQTIQVLTDKKKQEKTSLWQVLQKIAYSTQPSLSSRSLHGIKNFVEIIQEAQKRFQQDSLSCALKWFIQKINYKKAIEEEVKSEKARHMKWENVQECIHALLQYEEQSDTPSLQDFIATTLLSKENLYKQKTTFGDDRVRLITFHSAKGLEFPVCFLIGIEDHIVPHEKSLMDTGIEEERRLFYVAITRAMHNLTISMARKRKRNGKDYLTTPSRFLSEIPKDLLHITSWKTINAV